MSFSDPHSSVIFIRYATPGELIAAGVVLPILAVSAVILRVFVRISRKIPLGIDDWLLIPALLMVSGMGASLIVGAKEHAFGYPTPPPEGDSQEDLLNQTTFETVVVGKLEFSITLFLIIAYGAIKLSIVFFYRRMFVVPSTTKIFNVAT